MAAKLGGGCLLAVRRLVNHRQHIRFSNGMKSGGATGRWQRTRLYCVALDGHALKGDAWSTGFSEPCGWTVAVSFFFSGLSLVKVTVRTPASSIAVLKPFRLRPAGNLNFIEIIGVAGSPSFFLRKLKREDPDMTIELKAEERGSLCELTTLLFIVSKFPSSSTSIVTSSWFVPIGRGYLKRTRVSWILGGSRGQVNIAYDTHGSEREIVCLKWKVGPGVANARPGIVYARPGIVHVRSNGSDVVM
ncbi:hypothetical protein WN943_025776 [Citrus x changshan-huyou]